MVRVSLGEGNTPLIESVRIGRALGCDRLLFKLENCNPSGSYKDRFIAREIERMLGAGQRACVATSSGNTGSALAAYSARYGVSCAIVVNEHAPSGKLAQMKAHGARVLRVREFITSARVTAEVLELLRSLSASGALALVVSAYRYCPVGMAGVESIGAELRDARPAHVFVPVGSGGLFIATCRGLAGSGTRVHAVQPEQCSTVVAAWRAGANEITPVASTTQISGLAVPFDIDATLALEHLRAGGGEGIGVSDEQVFAAQRRLLLEEGIYCEPAGAAALAGLIQSGLRTAEPVVCIVSGHGFKDPDSVARVAGGTSEQAIGADQLESLLRSEGASE